MSFRDEFRSMGPSFRAFSDDAALLGSPFHFARNITLAASLTEGVTIALPATGDEILAIIVVDAPRPRATANPCFEFETPIEKGRRLR